MIGGMNEPARNLSIGDRVCVCETCWDVSIRGARGIITETDGSFRPHVKPGCFWVEFDEWISADDPAHPIEASEIRSEDLELLP